MRDLAIVGAGPAGMAATSSATAHGLSVAVIDEQLRHGGQIFRQKPATWTVPNSKATPYRWSRRLIHEAEQAPHADWRLGTTVLGILDGNSEGPLRVVLKRGEAVEILTARRVLIATGAMDLPVAFPGWTLPGVFTAGGIETLIKAQGLLPVRRLVLSGSHPLLLLVADLLLASGADIAEVVTPLRTLPTFEALAAIPGALGNASVMSHSAGALARLLRSGVRITRGALVTRANGDGHVQEAEIKSVDRHWRPTGPARTVPADGLVLGYGFQPSTDLARQAGCALRWDSPQGGWVVAHDDDLATSVAGIDVAGEPAGVSGAEVSAAEGRIAGLHAAATIGGNSPVYAAEINRARRSLRRAQRFATSVQRLFEPNRQALLELATHDTPVCRCENVTRASVEATLGSSPFITTANAVKLECRAGMGVCQGRYCEHAICGLISRARSSSLAAAGHYTGQFPVRPASVGEIAAAPRRG